MAATELQASFSSFPCFFLSPSPSLAVIQVYQLSVKSELSPAYTLQDYVCSFHHSIFFHHCFIYYTSFKLILSTCEIALKSQVYLFSNKIIEIFFASRCPCFQLHVTIFLIFINLPVSHQFPDGTFSFSSKSPSSLLSFLYFLSHLQFFRAESLYCVMSYVFLALHRKKNKIPELCNLGCR